MPRYLSRIGHLLGRKWWGGLGVLVAIVLGLIGYVCTITIWSQEIPAYELEIVISPREAADYSLDPEPNAQGRYTRGTSVTIYVLPKEGWQLRNWGGNLYFRSGETAKVSMNSDKTIAAEFAKVPEYDLSSEPTATIIPGPTATPIPPPSPSPTPSVVPTPETTPDLPEHFRSCTFYDDFEDGVPDGDKWSVILEQDDEGELELVYEQNGMLNFKWDGNTQEAKDWIQSQKQKLDQPGYWAWRGFHPIIPGIQEFEASFTASLSSYEGDKPGDVGITVYTKDHKDLSLQLSVGSYGSRVEYSIYREDFNPLPEQQDLQNVPMPMRVVSMNNKVEFYVNDVLLHSEPIDQTQIGGLRLFLIANPEAVFHVTIDDFCVKSRD